MVVSSDGAFIVSGSEDSTVKLWNIQERKEEYTFTGHILGVVAVAVSADNRFVVSGSTDNTIKIWSIHERREEWTFRGHTGWALSVIVSADMRFIVSGSQDHTVKVWNIKERREEYTFTGHNEYVRSVAVTGDSKFIVSGSYDNCIKMLNIQEWRKECIKQADLISPVAVSADGRLIATGFIDNTVKLWVTEDQREECAFIGHTRRIITVAISADCRFIVTGSEDNTIKVWNIHERREECTFSDFKQIQSVIISPDGKFIISKEFDCTVKIWNVQSRRKERFLIQQHSSLLKYILEINNLTNCKIFACSDFLILKCESEIIHIVRIYNGDLQFSFDLGVNFSSGTLLSDNFLKHLKSPEALSIAPECANDCNGILRFSLAHCFSYLGSVAKLKLLVENENFTITADAFNKSPFYYAINKKRQDCIDILLEKIGDMRLKHPKNHDLSILAIREDFLLLIKNSSMQLHHLLLGLISSSSLIYAKVPDALPILQVGITQNPLLTDFPENGAEDIPLVLQSSIFKLIGESGCEYNINILEAIINCKNSQGIRSPIINYIVEIQFNEIKHWVILYTTLLSLNMILIMFLIGLRSFHISLVIPFLLINALLIAWEMIQISTDAKGYLKDLWNYLDMMRVLASVAWIVLGLYGVSSLYFTWCVALLNLLRGITVFRLFDGTRFYIELITRSLNDIKYFFLMFAYSTFTFGFLLMISRDQGLGFTSIWGESYDLNFGNYEDTNTGIYFLQYIAYFGATVINVVLMLNLLISILGDSYERFQIEQTIVDIKEKARISMELQLMMFWTNKQSVLKYIRLCNSAFQDEDDQDWEGRIRFMDKKLDKSIKELTESNIVAVTKANEGSKSIEANINKSSISLEGKIQSVESKITSVEGNISDIRTSLESKNTSVEDKLTSVESKITSVESKISDVSASLESKITLVEGKMNDLNQKLEIILNIISK